MSLAEALGALRVRDLPRALTLLVEAWRRDKAIALGELVIVLADHAAAERPPVDDANWMTRALAGHPADLGLLLATLVGEDRAVAHRRLLAVMDRGDPRLGRFLARTIEAPPYNAREPARPFWRAIFGAAHTLGDPYLWSVREAMQRGHLRRFNGMSLEQEGQRERLASLLANYEQQFAHALPQLDAADRARVDEMHALLARDAGPLVRRASGGDELLQAVYDDPRDLARRAVFADWLGERGDPRGELITLQLAPPPLSPEADARMRALLDEHWRAWLGPLAPYCQGQPSFANGFLSELTIARVIDAPAVLANARWSTVEVVRGAISRELLRLAPLVALRRMELTLRAGDLDELGRRASVLASLEELSIELVTDAPAKVLRQQLEPLQHFPSLRCARVRLMRPRALVQLLWGGPALCERLELYDARRGPGFAGAPLVLARSPAGEFCTGPR